MSGRTVMKYLMYDMQGAMLGIIHSPVLSHKDMHQVNFHMLSRKYRLEVKLVSAGFIDLTTLKCYGESESLNNLKSRGDLDEAVFRDQPMFLPVLDQHYNWRN